MSTISKPLNSIKLTKSFITVLICSAGKQNNSQLIYNEEQLIELNATEGLRPDDLAYGAELTWRNFIDLNQQNGNIPFMAYQLYKKNAYYMLRDAFGDRFFIQSAGFGIVRSNYRLPKYNITFSSTKHKKVNLRKYLPNGNVGYSDYNHLSEFENNNEDIVYVGGKSYLRQFIELTSRMPNRKIIFYKGNPDLRPYRNLNQQFVFVKYEPETTARAWYYELADRLAEAEIIQRL